MFFFNVKVNLPFTVFNPLFRSATIQIVLSEFGKGPTIFHWLTTNESSDYTHNRVKSLSFFPVWKLGSFGRSFLSVGWHSSFFNLVDHHVPAWKFMSPNGPQSRFESQVDKTEFLFKNIYNILTKGVCVCNWMKFCLNGPSNSKICRLTKLSFCSKIYITY
jgi:hypothetical protein